MLMCEYTSTIRRCIIDMTGGVLEEEGKMLSKAGRGGIDKNLCGGRLQRKLEWLEKAIIDRKEKTGRYPKAIVPVALSFAAMRMMPMRLCGMLRRPVMRILIISIRLSVTIIVCRMFVRVSVAVR